MALYEFKLPDVGEGVVEGEIVKWLVKAGDTVKEDQPLVEVMTDKATVTIPSPKPGTVLKTHGNEGEIAKVHATLVTLELTGPAPVEAPPLVPSSPLTDPVLAVPPNGGGQASASKVLATPVTRRMARELGLDIGAIAGSGPQGRITKADVQAVVGGPRNGSPAGAVAPARAQAPVMAPAPAVTRVAGDQRVPLRGLRKKIAEKMVRSKFTAPHFTFVEEFDATELVNLRKRLNAQLEAQGDSTHLSFLPLIFKGLVAALRKFPGINANMDEAAQELVLRGELNFGIAVATDDGLTVPVVKHVDRLSVRSLGQEIARLGEAARERRLKMEELTGGTFTITSLGQTGGLFATPIINHPEVAILGVHKLRKKPVVTEDDQIVIRQMMYLSLSFDHRVVDGAVGAAFTYELIRYLEHPELLLLELV